MSLPGHCVVPVLTGVALPIFDVKFRVPIHICVCMERFGAAAVDKHLNGRMTMEDDRETEIQRRAHAIWEREGHPEGAHSEHWAEAERDYDAEVGTGGKADSQTIEGDDLANPRAMREAAREHSDTYLVATDLEDDDQRTNENGTREQE